MLYEFSFSFKFLFPLENSRTTAANYLTKGNRQSILVVVVLDAIMQMSYWLYLWPNVYRYKIPDLLNHPFFQDSGVRVELAEGSDPSVGDLVKLQLHLEDPKKRRDKHKENEAIQFDFYLVHDQPEKVAEEMVSKSFVFFVHNFLVLQLGCERIFKAAAMLWLWWVEVYIQLQ